MTNEDSFKAFTKRMDKAIAEAKQMNRPGVYGIKLVDKGVVLKKTIDASRVLSRYADSCDRLGIKLKFRKSNVSSLVGKINYVADATW